MKAVRRIIVCLVITALIFCFSRFLAETDIVLNLQPTVFETGSYADYYYQQLTPVQKQAYTAVRENILTFPLRIEIPELDSEALNTVLSALICDDPWLFMFNSCTVVTQGSKHYFLPEYQMNIDDYSQACSLIGQAADAVLADMPQALSSTEKEKYLHDSIVNSCSYSETDSYNEATVEGVFIDKKAKCSGYSKAFKLLLEKADIESVLISGTATDYEGNTSNHMWNAVELDGQWYFTDITWDDPVSDSGESYCRHIYFNMNSDMLNRTHGSYSFLYPCTDSSLYHYIDAGIYFNDYNKEAKQSIARSIAQAADSLLDCTEFMFSSDEAFELAYTSLFEGEEIYGLLEKADRLTDKKITTNAVRYQIDSDTRLITIIIEIG